jgi:hypothetical protein
MSREILKNFQLKLDVFGGNGWLLNDTVDYNGFCNVELIDLKPEHYRFCLTLNHSSFFDCLHLHGVTEKYLVNPKLASKLKPWETQPQAVIQWVEENREEFLKTGVKA